MYEKSELARQILFSFIVQSEHNKDPVSEPTVSKKSFKFSKNSSDAIENDSAIIKIFHGNESVK